MAIHAQNKMLVSQLRQAMQVPGPVDLLHVWDQLGVVVGQSYER